MTRSVCREPASENTTHLRNQGGWDFSLTFEREDRIQLQHPFVDCSAFRVTDQGTHWLTPVISTLPRLRQVDLLEVEASLGYLVSSKLAWSVNETLSLRTEGI